MSMSQLAMDHDSAKQSTADVLRDLHCDINALGGQPDTDYSRGVHETVAQALAIIEAKQAEISHGA